LRICEISRFFVYNSYRQKASAMKRLTGEKQLLIIPARWSEGYHGTSSEIFESEEYHLHEHTTLLNWKIWGGKRHHLYLLSSTIIKDMKKYQPQFIVIDSSPYSLLALEVAIIRKMYFPKAKLILHSSQNIYKSFPFPFNRIEKYLYKQADALFARTEEIKDVSLKKECVCPIHIIPHGIDTQKFSPIKEALEDVALKEDCFHIGYVGSLVHQKGIHVLIKSISDIDIPFKLSIIGDGPMKSSLKLQASVSANASRINFIDSIPNAKLPKMLSKFDVLILPSLTLDYLKEQFGRILVEALACGIPVIGSNSGAIPEVIGDCGIIVDEGNVQQLQTAIINLRADEKFLKQLSMAARKRALKYYSWDVIVQKIFKIYSEIIIDNSNSMLKPKRM
jgi:glycosyltransferase involved in cell wall biosynthesis